jgi:hypothetical protein
MYVTDAALCGWVQTGLILLKSAADCYSQFRGAAGCPVSVRFVSGRLGLRVAQFEMLLASTSERYEETGHVQAARSAHYAAALLTGRQSQPIER